MRKPTIILSFLVALFVSSAVHAQDEIDYVALATTLAGDGHFDRAELALKNVDLNDEEIDKESYYLVAGLVFLNQSRWDEAIVSFESLLAIAPPKDGWVYGYFAQALHGSQRYNEALKNLRKVGQVGANDPGLWLIKIDCEKKLNRDNDAWESLKDASNRFESDVRFPRLRTMFLLELGLYSEAAEQAKSLIDHPKSTPEDALAFAEGLRKGGAYDRAIRFLEKARLKYTDARFDALLGYCYANQSNFSAAGELLAIAAERDPKFRAEAAEMFRKNGNLVRAMYHNSLVIDSKIKLRQRVAILVEESKYEEIASMYPRLKRQGVLDEDAIRYAVAYAQFQIGQVDASLKTLKGIKDSSYFESATQLRELIARCTEEDAC